MRYRWIAGSLVLLGAGCNRQDAECLGRIGNLVVHRLETLKPNSGGKETGLANTLPGYGGPDAKGDTDQQNK